MATRKKREEVAVTKDNWNGRFRVLYFDSQWELLDHLSLADATGLEACRAVECWCEYMEQKSRGRAPQLHSLMDVRSVEVELSNG